MEDAQVINLNEKLFTFDGILIFNTQQNAKNSWFYLKKIQSNQIKQTAKVTTILCMYVNKDIKIFFLKSNRKIRSSISNDQINAHLNKDVLQWCYFIKEKQMNKLQRNGLFIINLKLFNELLNIKQYKIQWYKFTSCPSGKLGSS